MPSEYMTESEKHSQNQPKNVQKLFFDVLKNCPYDSNEFSIVVLHYIRVLYVQRHQNRMAGI